MKILKEENELQKRAKYHKKRQKGMSPFYSPDGGNVPLNISRFNNSVADGANGLCESAEQDWLVNSYKHKPPMSEWSIIEELTKMGYDYKFAQSVIKRLKFDKDGFTIGESLSTSSDGLCEDLYSGSYGFVSLDTYKKIKKLSDKLTNLLTKYDEIIDSMESNVQTDEEWAKLENNPSYKTLIKTYQNNYEIINLLSDMFENDLIQVDENPRGDDITIDLNIYNLSDLQNLYNNLENTLKSITSTYKENMEEDFDFNPLKEVVLKICDFLWEEGFAFPGDDLLADDWNNLKDGVEMGVDPLDEVAQFLVGYLEDTLDNVASELYPTVKKLYSSLLKYLPKNESLKEDTVKNSDGTWSNKGDEGSHGKFKTKKQADKQRKAMFANGYRESLKENFNDLDPEKFDILKKKGFNSDGGTYVFLGDTYARKDEIKKLGGKFDPVLGWHIDEPVQGFNFADIYFDDVAIDVDPSGWGEIIYKDNAADLIRSLKNQYKIKMSGGKQPEFVGEVGEKYSGEVTLKRISGYGANFGYRGTWVNIFIFEDPDGNQIVWKTSKDIDLEENGQYYITGIVKDHNEYRGNKQTILKNCKIEPKGSRVMESLREAWFTPLSEVSSFTGWNDDDALLDEEERFNARVEKALNTNRNDIQVLIDSDFEYDPRSYDFDNLIQLQEVKTKNIRANKYSLNGIEFVFEDSSSNSSPRLYFKSEEDGEAYTNYIDHYYDEEV